MSAFEVVAASGALDPLDLHLARLLWRREPGDGGGVIALTAALLSRERARGHSCIDPRDWTGHPFPTDSDTPLPRLPELREWEHALSSSPLVGSGGAATPLVRDAAGRVYLRRYWRAEQRLAAALRQRLETRPRASNAELTDPGGLAPLFRRLFPPAESRQVDWQAVAAAAALASPVALVTGGPGTGKTTTVARILVLLLAADPELRIDLAAPTGKAAARLGEAISEQVETLPIEQRLRDTVPREASTLHRLLGYLPRHDRFRYHAGRPLTCDLLVVDEASMVDLLLMDAALEALPPRARVVLLGDKDQLASVETGFVFGDLCTAARSGDSGSGATEAANAYSDRFADFYRRLSGRELRAPHTGRTATPRGLLANAAVELRTSYRFRDQPGIGELATAVRARDADRTLAVLGEGQVDDVEHMPPAEAAERILEPLRRPLEAYLAAASPAAALEALAAFRLLCARRTGPWGVEGMNAVVERHLADRGHPVAERWYRGRPILVTANDYQVRLFNGDLGVCWPEAGRLWAWFGGGRSGGDTEPRRLPLAKLPPHDTAWAMTVHKSQGSEFDHVTLVLGDSDSSVMTRELLYTGVTRARRRLTVVGTPEVIRGAIARGSRRRSGLVDALAGGSAPRHRTPEPPPPTEPSDEPARDDGESDQLSLF
ncbi:MAG: exodeoxyribonuclease V subunit alpha [bacterium]|nr:exodeoxyribonuclease V subunit alpha [bacterium]